MKKLGQPITFLSLLTDPEAREKLGALIDAIVDFLNYVKLNESAVNRPKLIN